MNNKVTDNLWMRRIFDSVPEKYNFLNRILTVGRDDIWRETILEVIEPQKADRILDICTGTGVLALKLAERFPRSRVYAIDFSHRMLSYAKRKASDIKARNITFIECDCGNMGFSSNYFNYITISFGFRNLAYSHNNLTKSLKEIHRILENKGRLIILETSQPVNIFVKRIFHFYALRIVPVIGEFFSGQNKPYLYLGESIVKFFDKDRLNSILAKEGFIQQRIIPFMSGMILLSVFQKESL